MHFIAIPIVTIQARHMKITWLWFKSLIRFTSLKDQMRSWQQTMRMDMIQNSLLTFERILIFSTIFFKDTPEWKISILHLTITQVRWSSFAARALRGISWGMCERALSLARAQNWLMQQRFGELSFTMYTVYIGLSPPPSNCDKWRFRLGSPILKMFHNPGGACYTNVYRNDDNL